MTAMEDFMKDADPIKTAKELHREKFPVLKYMEIQKQREARLERFKEIGIPVLIDFTAMEFTRFQAKILVMVWRSL